jgi:hypothetical protein
VLRDPGDRAGAQQACQTRRAPGRRGSRFSSRPLNHTDAMMVHLAMPGPCLAGRRRDRLYVRASGKHKFARKLRCASTSPSSTRHMSKPHDDQLFRHRSLRTSSCVPLFAPCGREHVESSPRLRTRTPPTERAGSIALWYVFGDCNGDGAGQWSSRRFGKGAERLQYQLPF